MAKHEKAGPVRPPVLPKTPTHHRTPRSCTISGITAMQVVQGRPERDPSTRTLGQGLYNTHSWFKSGVSKAYSKLVLCDVAAY